MVHNLIVRWEKDGEPDLLSMTGLVEIDSEAVRRWNAQGLSGDSADASITIEKRLDLDPFDHKVTIESEYGTFRAIRISPQSGFGMEVTSIMGKRIRS